jgi:hypothetical protein
MRKSHIRHMLNPAHSIVARCGGIQTVADWLRLNRTSVLRWTHPRDRGGTGGLIPSKHQAKLMRAAGSHGVTLRPEDFFNTHTTPQASASVEVDHV